MAQHPIDWDAAIRTGQRLAPRGPAVTAREAHQVVADLHRFSADAEHTVRQTTGLGLDLPVADAEVVDRRGWVAAAAAGMAELTEPLAARLLGEGQAGGAAGSQIGILLGYMAGRVLGQYDPVGGGGRLLLVAPNVIKVEREIAAAPVDFRLWVCLHESTHRLQFSAIPWMTQHFRALVDEYSAIAPVNGRDLLRRIGEVVRGGASPESPESSGDGTATDAARGADYDAVFGNSWIRRIQTPAQQVLFDRLMALMTLLEGHADYVMDAVGPSVIPSVRQIRDAFAERRRKGRGPIDRLVRALLGMDAKMAQYVKGAEFVRSVVDRVGMDRFNEVFASPETLPTLREIAEPDRWLHRVPG